MDPNQPPPAPQQPLPQAQYDFITNPPKPSKRSIFSTGGDKKSLLILIVGGIGIFSVLLLLFSLIFGGGGDKELLLPVARKQSQIIAIAEVGGKDGGTKEAQSLAWSVQLALMTEQRNLLAQIYKNGKPKAKEYQADPSTEVLTQLETAQRNGRFDEVFTNIIEEELTEYQQELRTANNAITSEKTKKLLASDFESVGLLLSIPAN